MDVEHAVYCLIAPLCSLRSGSTRWGPTTTGRSTRRRWSAATSTCSCGAWRPTARRAAETSGPAEPALTKGRLSHEPIPSRRDAASPRIAAREGPHMAIPPAGSGARRRPARRGAILPRLVVLLLVAAGGLSAAAWYYVRGPQAGDGRLVLQGNIDVRQVNLAFKVDGRIETLAVDEGDPVEAGQVARHARQALFRGRLRLARARRDNAAGDPGAARARLAARGDRRGAGAASPSSRRRWTTPRPTSSAREALVTKGARQHARTTTTRRRPFGEAEAQLALRRGGAAAGRDRPAAGRHRRRPRPARAARRPRSSRPSGGWPTAT